MKKETEANSIGIGSGVSSLLMVFVILCVTILAILSYLQAKQDATAFEKSLKATQEYYAADKEAIKQYAKIDELLDASASIEELRASGYQVADGKVYLSFAVNENQTLVVVLAIAPEPRTSRLSIEQWQLVNSPKGSYDASGFID